MSARLEKMRLGARAWVVHLVPDGSEEALCGKSPKSKRGRWVYEPGLQVSCSKCKARMEQRDHPVSS